MATTRAEGGQIEARPCPYCRTLFTPKRPRQEFCGDKCRFGFHTHVGTEGKVASVRRLNRGASVVVHLTGPAAEQALQLRLGDRVRLVRKERES